jgi:hypothetical protein
MLIIDPPIGPAHGAKEIRAWIKELVDMVTEFTAADDLATVRSELVRARGWLKRRLARGDQPSPGESTIRP